MLSTSRLLGGPFPGFQRSPPPDDWGRAALEAGNAPLNVPDACVDTQETFHSVCDSDSDTERNSNSDARSPRACQMRVRDIRLPSSDRSDRRPSDRHRGASLSPRTATGPSIPEDSDRHRGASLTSIPEDSDRSDRRPSDRHRGASLTSIPEDSSVRFASSFVLQSVEGRKTSVLYQQVLSYWVM